MMFYEDRRTPEERLRDLKRHEKRESDQILARGFLEACRKHFMEVGGEVGLVGDGLLGSVDLLILDDGITYKISCRVDSGGG